MKFKLAALVLVGVLSFNASQSAFAQGTYEFVGFSINIAFPEIIQRPVYAELELSGESPYDHTNIKSLTFSPEAGEIFGYVGEYKGTIDSSSLSFVETAGGRLASSDYDGGNVIDTADLIDSDPPPFDVGDVEMADNSILQLIFSSPQSAFIGVTGTQKLERNFVRGVWTRVIPEPSSLVLVAIGASFLYGFRRR